MKFFKKKSSRSGNKIHRWIHERQRKIIHYMPTGGHSEAERIEYASFLIRSLKQCPIKKHVKATLTKEIGQIDYSQPQPTLYRRLSWKVLMALDEKAMADDPKSKDQKKHAEPRQQLEKSLAQKCQCSNRETHGFNPITCFTRTLQSIFGVDNVVALIRGDAFTLSFSKKPSFPWDKVVSFESGIYVKDDCLKGSSPKDLFDAILSEFSEHVSNWPGRFDRADGRQIVKILLGAKREIALPLDVGESDIIAFSDLYGNITTTTGFLCGSENAKTLLAASMAELGMGKNYHLARTVNFYNHTYSLAKAWSGINRPHPDILKGWGKVTTPAYSYLLLSLLNALKGGH